MGKPFLSERLFKASTCFSVCFSKAFSRAEYVNLACSIIWFWLWGNVSLPVRYSYLSILLNDKAVFAGSLLI